jgi:hypothetical protein
MHISSRLRRGAGAALAVGAAALVLAPAGPASAAGGAHTQSYTDNFHGTQPFDDLNPCTNDELTGSQESNVVEHVTFFPDSDEVWATFTETDRIAATDEATGVVYSGRSTFWGNLNLNRQSSNDSFTGSMRVTGSDGSVITFHEVMHETFTPDGNLTVSFDRPTMSCSS